MNDKKKKILTTAAVVTVLGMLGAMMAYLIASDAAPNRIKVGKGDAEIVESFDPPKKLEQGSNIYQKLVTVQNEGKNPCFARVFMDFTDAEVKSSEGITSYFFVPDDINNIPQTAPGKGAQNSDGTWTTTGGTWVEVSKWSPSAGWEYIEDGGLAGYYYYKKPLAPGESAPPLISWVRTDFNNESYITDYEILVYSETVQVVEIDTSGTVYDENAYQTAWQNYLRVEPFTMLRAATYASAKDMFKNCTWLTELPFADHSHITNTAS